MRIKKVFELKSEDLFQEISSVQYAQYLSRHSSYEKFNDDDKKYMNENGIEILLRKSTSSLPEIQYGKKRKVKPLKLEFDVFKLEDDWYFVSYSGLSSSSYDVRRFYKCDQLEGLIDFMNKIPHWSLKIK